MCFHGRSNSLVAGDSVAGTVVISVAVETEPDVMEVPANRNRKRFPSAVLKGRRAGNESYPSGVPLWGLALCKQSALQKPEFLNIMPSSRRSPRRAHPG